LGVSKVYYSYTDANSCSATDSFAFTVHSLPVISFNPAQTCANISSMVLTASPSGGTFSGNYVNGNIFNPSAAGAGNHPVTYSYTDGFGCSNSDTKSVVVNALPVINFSMPHNLCHDGAPVNLSATPSGGSFSGTGVTGNLFSPSTAGIGTHNIIYSYTAANLCSNTDTQTVTVHGPPAISLASVDSSYCFSNTPDTLSGIPAGGTFSGSGIIGNLFISSVAGLGNHWIKYSYSDSIGCHNADSLLVTVFPVPTASFSGLALNYCLNDDADTLVPQPAGGTFSGSGISGNLFIPASAGTGSKLITYLFTDSNNCSVSVMQSTTVNPLPAAFAGNDTLIPCNSGGVVIGQPSQSGLSYFWQPSTGLNNVSLANPLANPLTTTTYVLTVNDIVSHCKNYDTVTVSLPDGPVISVSADTAICLNDTASLWVSGGTKWLWSTGDTVQQLSVAPSGNTVYGVTAFNAMMCATKDSVEVKVFPLPVPNLGSDSVNTDSITLYPGVFASYLWSTGDTTPTIVVLNPTGQTYWVTVKDSNSCSATDSIYVYYVSIGDIISGVTARLYPNPTRDVATIEFSQPVPVKEWSLFDASGRMVDNHKLSGKTKTFKVSVATLQRGTYFLKLIFDGKSKTLPIFVQ
jgi:hypothetical protein